jgi:glycosyltransferase involved in cell wall biosynthesis
MVLVEAMQYGCVPFAFDTFTALHDIIDDGVNGIIIPPPPSDQEDVHADQEYAHRLLHFLRQDESKIRIVQKNAIQKSHKFDVDNIGAKWLSLLKSFPLKE